MLVVAGMSMSEATIACYLFTLGEVVQLCPGKVPKRVFLLVQSMVAAPCISTLPASQPSQAHSDSGGISYQLLLKLEHYGLLSCNTKNCIRTWPDFCLDPMTGKNFLTTYMQLNK